jgi:chemotaxis protein CheC
MNLSAIQKAALMELINIGFGQAARSLGSMVNRQVHLDAPYLEVIPISNLDSALYELADTSVLTIHQFFSGELSGDMMLLFDARSTPRLAQLFKHGQDGDTRVKSDCDTSEEADDIDCLTELGNILLGAFASSFGNLLHIQIRFTVPELKKDSLLSMLESIKMGNEEVRYAVIIRIFFRLIEDDIESRMLIVMGVSSLEALFKAIEKQGFIIN